MNRDYIHFLATHLSIYPLSNFLLSRNLAVHPSNHLPIHTLPSMAFILPIHPSLTHASVHPFIHSTLLPIQPTICPSIFIHPSTIHLFPPIYPSILPYISSRIHSFPLLCLSFHLSIHPSTDSLSSTYSLISYLFVCLFVKTGSYEA